MSNLRWKFIKENKKVRKQDLDQESDQEKNKKERKHALDQESVQEKTITAKEKKGNTLATKKATMKKEKLSFFFSYFLVFFHKFSPQGAQNTYIHFLPVCVTCKS